MLRVRMHPVKVLANLLYPPACLLCRSRLQDMTGALFCDDCRQTMPRNGPPLCVRCGIELQAPFDALLSCATCQKHSFAFEMARAPWQYRGATQEAVHQLKYHRRWRIGRWLAHDMAQTARACLPLTTIAVVLPVPLYWLKHRLKGFNPAEQLASAVAQSLGKPSTGLALRRTRWTGTQTSLHIHERFRNVRGAFRAKPRFVHNHNVLLVDDVLTSGATAHACALALKTAGAQSVFVLTAARTPRS